MHYFSNGKKLIHRLIYIYQFIVKNVIQVEFFFFINYTATKDNFILFRC